jgi:hypothetical protein
LQQSYFGLMANGGEVAFQKFSVVSSAKVYFEMDGCPEEADLIEVLTTLMSVDGTEVFLFFSLQRNSIEIP